MSEFYSRHKMLDPLTIFMIKNIIGIFLSVADLALEEKMIGLDFHVHLLLSEYKPLFS